MSLPSPGPALGAYSMGREVEKVLAHLRVHKMNSNATPFGYADLCAFLRAACREAESYFPSEEEPEELAEAPMPPVDLVPQALDETPGILKAATRRRKA